MFYYIVCNKKFNLSSKMAPSSVDLRIIGGFITAFLLSLLIGRWFIEKSTRFRCSSRVATPANHRFKDNIPTMGGLFVIGAVIMAVLIWCNLSDAKVWFFFLVFLSFGAIGYWDDRSKIVRQLGISAAYKFMLQLIITVLIVSALVISSTIEPTITIPYWQQICSSSAVLLVWASFVLIGCSNAVNLTDGLDGLAASSLIPNFAVFALIAYLAGEEEIAVIAATLIGGVLGFLWYNAHPAQIFMGDVGSLALGAALAYIALVCKHEFLLILTGGLFVVETISVMLQVCSRRMRGKKLFLMAPIHHHFELLGCPESRITTRLSIVSYILSALAIIALKLL